MLARIRPYSWRALVCFGAFLFFSTTQAEPLAAPATQPPSFQRDIAPILQARCVKCHGPEKSKGKFRLDSFAQLSKPGESKAIPIVPGAPQKSEIYRLLITGDEEDRMPKKSEPLPPAQVRLLEKWIEGGAKFDGPDPAAPLSSLIAPQEHPAPPEAYRRPVPIAAVAFSPDGAVLAVGGYHEVTLWDAVSGKLLNRIKKLPERTYGLAYSPDGRWLAIAGGNPGLLGEARLCDPKSQTPGKVLESIPDVMLAVRFSPDGARLAAAGADNAIHVYNIATGKQELRIEQHADWVTDIAFSPDGQRLASASRDKSARVFDAKTGAMQQAFLGHEEPVFAVAWSADGKSIFSAGRDRKIRAWNAADAKQIGESIVLKSEPLKLDSALGLLFCGGADGSLTQYSQDKREVISSYPQAADRIDSIAVDAKHRRIATGSHNGQVRVIDIDGAGMVTSFIAAPGYVKRD